MANAPSVRRRLVGSSLRRYRESLGYDLGLAARILECDPSKISRIETGQRGIRPKELRELLTEYGVDSATQDALVAITRPGEGLRWWQAYADVLATDHLDYLAAESAASGILAYAPVQVPDLLYTLEYARAVTSADASVPEEAEDATVAATLAHQHAAFRDRDVDLVVVIGEAALRQEIGSTEVMGAQLRYLAELSSGHPHVTIGVLPFSAGAHAAGGGGEFSVLQFGQVPAFGLVHLAGPSGGICLDAPATVAAYVRTFTQLRLFSLGPDESARKLREVARC